jgi:FKBP-type peptidyl-prolyl cis-trans isomerase FkpA
MLPVMTNRSARAFALAGALLFCVLSPFASYAVPTEIEFTDQIIGNGPEPRRGWFAIIRYTGWIYDEQAVDRKGRKFINSDDRGAPVSFVYGYKRALPGLEKGMEGMKPGGRRTVIIPAKSAYRGARQEPPDGVPIDATLIIEIELVDVVPQANSAPEQ